MTFVFFFQGILLFLYIGVQRRMSSKAERRGIYVDQATLLCKKGCGFYGNATWGGFCSKCWREDNQKARTKQIEEDHALAQR